MIRLKSYRESASLLQKGLGPEDEELHDKVIQYILHEKHKTNNNEHRDQHS